MKKILILTLIVLLGNVAFSENVEVSNDYFDQDYVKGLDYDNYIGDPSQAIYNETQETYIYDNYGSTESMEYLNRGDAGNYNGGSDFDRNY